MLSALSRRLRTAVRNSRAQAVRACATNNIPCLQLVGQAVLACPFTVNDPNPPGR
jgi:hypothetical protein